MVEVTDLSYAAGVIDSDGSIGIIKAPRKQGFNGYCVRVDVSMTTSGVPLWFHNKFEGCIFEYNKNYKHGRRTLWRWGLYGKHASAFLKKIIPYLIEKKQRAKLAVEMQSLDRGQCGNKMPSDEWIAERDRIFSEIQSINYKLGRGGKNQYSKMEV